MIISIILTAAPFITLGVFGLIEEYRNYKFRNVVSMEAVSKTYNIKES